MKKISLLFTVLIASLLALMPFILNQEISSKIALSTSIVSSLSSMVTLIIALLLYKEYGIENKLLEKNLESTEELLSELAKIRIIFKSASVFIQFFPLKKEFYRNDIDVKNYKKMQVVFSRKGLENLGTISEFAYDPFLPKSIALAIKPFEFVYGVEISNIMNNSDFLMADISNSSKDSKQYDSEKNNDTYLRFNNEMVTLEEFQNRWKDLTEIIRDWIRNNSSNYKELNL